MKKYFMLVILAVFLTGCESVKSDVVYGTPEWHTQEIEKLKTAYQNGEITKEEYEEMKESTDRLLTKWNATKGVRAIRY